MRWKNLAVCLLGLAFVTGTFAEETLNDLYITGEGEISLPVTLANVRVSIELSEKEATQVQKKLAEKSEQVLKVLKQFNPKQIKTENIHLSPKYSRDKTRSLLGYIGTMSISYEADVEKAGEVLDAVIGIGVNRIDGIYLKASDEAVKQAQSVALELASKNGLKKADVILKSLGLKRVGIRQIRADQSYRPPPVHARFKMAAMMDVGAEGRTEIVGGQQKVKATVNLTIAYQ